MSGTAERWAEFERHQREVAQWAWLRALAGWDQQTGMPPGGASDRGEQEALLTRLLHESSTSPRYGELLAALDAAPDLNPLQRRAVDRASWGWRRESAVSPALAERVSRVRSETTTAWLSARETGETAAWTAKLADCVAVTRERAEAVAARLGGPARPVYDVLLEDYDRGASSAWLASMFDRLVPALTDLVREVEVGPDDPPLAWSVSVEDQRQLSRDLVEAVGFDLSAGRQDRSEHPFTTRCGVRDVRITTRFLADDPMSAVYSTLHEVGHGMYEQGMDPALLSAGLMGAPGTGLHESQSRFWENAVGRSEAFVDWLHGLFRRRLGDHVPPVEDLLRHVRRVERSFVRVEADQTTYNLHVALRFDLERRLFAGELEVADLSGAWDEAMVRTLGLRPTSPAEGVLQDIHWSYGLFGYFPSYTLGNLYAASFLGRLREERPNLDDELRAGHFAPTLSWFRERVHTHGDRLDASDIVHRVVGERDHVADLLGVLRPGR